MLTLNNHRRLGAARVLVYAVIGYVGVLGFGMLASAAVAGGDSFADVALAAVTLVFLAPLGALAGAAIGLYPYRNARLHGTESFIFWALPVIVIAGASAASARNGLPVGLAVFMLGLAAMAVIRVALIERQAGSAGRMEGR